MKHTQSIPLRFLAPIIALLMTPCGADALVFFWDAGGADNNYTTALNWDLDAVPDDDDLAVHNNGALPSIEINSNVSADSLRLTDGGSVIQTSGTTTIATGVGPDNGLWVGEFGPATATYELQGGTIVINDLADSFDVGRGDGATGVFNMSAGTVINNGMTDAFFVGRFTGSTGTVNLSGGTLNGPSTDTHIGLDGTATWNQDGGTFNAAGVHIGRFASPTATVNLAGSAVWTSALVLLADGSETIGSAVSADLNVFGNNVDFDSTGLVIRDKGTLHFDAQNVGVSTLNLNGGELLLDNATLQISNLPAFAGMEMILIDNIGTYTGEATFDNAPEGTIYAGGWSLDYRATQIALVPEPSAAALVGLGLAGLLMRRRRQGA